MKVAGIIILMILVGMLAPAGTVHAGPFTGLWVGTVTVDKVSESQILVSSLTPTEVGTPFKFRILVHVDTAGNSRLIKDVIQMWKPGPPGHYALVSDDTLIPDNFVCDNFADTEFCHRISTAAYDFDGLHLNLSGTFSLAGQLNGSIILTPENPTNPFLHRFNPEHDNLNEEFKPLKNFAAFDTDGNEAKRVCSLTEPKRSCNVDADCPAGEICAVNTPVLEVYRVVRDVTLTFSSTDPAGTYGSPRWGSSLMGGVYQETLKGLHKNSIYVSGTFRIQRVTDIGELNQ